MEKEITSRHWSIYTCCQAGYLDRVKYHVEILGSDINEPDIHNSVPLFYACLCGHADIVKYLLEKGAKLNRGKFETERCFYAAHDQNIRRLLESYQGSVLGDVFG